MFKILKDGLPDFMRSMKVLQQSEVLVGVPADNITRKEVEGEPPSMTNAQIMFINEHGSPAQNIPARPSLGPGIKKNQPRIEKAMRKAAQDALETRDPSKVTQQLNIAGLAAQNGAKAVIREGLTPELAPGTLAARRARGRTGEKPLIDTGQLLNSITYVIRRRS